MAGISTRALAASAARAGYHVTAVDAFGDLDLRRTADSISSRAEEGAQFKPMTAAIAADQAPGGLACYTSNFENYPAAVDRLAEGRTLLGNPASVLRRVRDPLLLMQTLEPTRIFDSEDAIIPTPGAECRGRVAAQAAAFRRRARHQSVASRSAASPNALPPAAACRCAGVDPLCRRWTSGSGSGSQPATRGRHADWEPAGFDTAAACLGPPRFSFPINGS